MTARAEDGYVLASALAVLLAISLVAAALVSTSVDVVRGAKRAEADAVADLALRSALLVATSQLSQDPRRRQLAFEGMETFDVLGRSIKAQASWESLKLDINLADPEAVDQRLADAGVEQDVRGRIVSEIEERRASEEPIGLLDDVLPQTGDQECLRSILTIFGGRPDYDPDEQDPTPQIGRPAAGARMSIDVWLADKPAQSPTLVGINAIVIMTGDPAAPAKVLDQRRTRLTGEERCHDASKS